MANLNLFQWIIWWRFWLKKHTTNYDGLDALYVTSLCFVDFCVDLEIETDVYPEFLYLY